MPGLITNIVAIIRTQAFLMYVGLFLLAYGFFLLVLLPAAYLLPANKLGPDHLNTNRIQGTIWQGKVGAVEWRELSATQVAWRFNPWSLPSGAWEYHTKLAFNKIPLVGKVAKRLDGAWRVRDLKAEAPLQDVLQLVHNLYPLPQVKVQGQLAINLDELLLTDMWPQMIQGTFVLNSLQIDELPNLGDWQGQIATQSDKITLAFTPQGDILQGSGRWELSTDQRWLFSLQIKAGDAATNDLTTWFRLLGSPDAEGYYRIQQEGQLY